MGRLRYRVAGHGADLVLFVYGAAEEEVFARGAKALFSVIIEGAAVEAVLERRIVVEGESLLVPFLNELLFLWDTVRFIPGGVRVRVEGERAEATVWGEQFREDRHRVLREVKAATYHGYEMKRIKGRLRARVVIDI
jgi:SHS2 domain-containing protein